MPYIFLAIAIIAEVIATSSLKASQSFTRLWPSVVVVLGYGVAFYCLSLSLRSMSVGVAYAIWTAVGMVLVTIVAAVMYKQVPDGWALLGFGLIIAGVVVLQAFSKMEVHG